MELRNNIKQLGAGLCALMLGMFMSSCEQEDQAKEYGISSIYMPQSVNVSLGLNALFPVPNSSNYESSTGYNYIVDSEAGTTNVLLGVMLSGSHTSAYSVEIVSDKDTINDLISKGTLGENYIALPENLFKLPANIDVPESGRATFQLSIQNSVITNPEYFDKHLIAAVRLRNPSKYALHESNAVTIVDLHIAGLFPSARRVSDYAVRGGSIITIEGQNLKDVSELKLTGTEIAIPITNQSANSITVEMPELGAFTRGTIDLVTPFGTTKSAFEIFNIDQALQVFADAYGEGVAANTDGDDYGSRQSVSTTTKRRGTSSLAITYFGNNYSPGGLINNAGFIDQGYEYIVFWAKSTTNGNNNGGIQMSLMGDGMPAGYGNDFAGAAIVVGPEWTFYKIPIGKTSATPMWSKGSSFRKFGWRLNNWNVPNDETVYFDDVMFIK
ncbi:BT_3987 domain-containing protein [Sphingobacterium corticis]